MKRWVWIVLLAVVGVALVGTLATVAWFTVGRNLLWGARSFGMRDMWGRGTSGNQCDRAGGRGFGGPSMMGGPGVEADTCAFLDDEAELDTDTLTLADAQTAFERYLSGIGYDDLEIAEVMEFEHNFYAVAEEPATGMGAMELLLDKNTGSIGPEPGPNMMWNEQYGMHGGTFGGRGMMGGVGRTRGNISALSEENALAYAQAWAEDERPPLAVEERSDTFYGYYTFHTLRDGQIEGMLSVDSSSGDIWYHTWHGDFIAMAGEEGH